MDGGRKEGETLDNVWLFAGVGVWVIRIVELPCGHSRVLMIMGSNIVSKSGWVGSYLLLN